LVRIIWKKPRGFSSFTIFTGRNPNRNSRLHYQNSRWRSNVWSSINSSQKEVWKKIYALKSSGSKRSPTNYLLIQIYIAFICIWGPDQVVSNLV
jgi:hypothetical protein